MFELLEMLVNLLSKVGEAPQVPSGIRRSTGNQTQAPLPKITAARPGQRGMAAQPKRAPVRRRMAPPPIALAAPVMTGRTAATPAQAPAVKAVAPVSTAAASAPLPPATAATYRRWLNPRTLRHQFLLTEMFQPPLALREDSHLNR